MSNDERFPGCVLDVRCVLLFGHTGGCLGPKVFVQPSTPVCVCGHPKSEHHISWLPGGAELVEECEWEGSNETGGMVIDPVTGKWIEHCFKFKERERNNG